MTRFYFDIDDGVLHTRDDVGVMLADRQAARNAAIETLPAIAGERLPTGEHHNFKIDVRDDSGVLIFRANLAFTSEWIRYDLN